MEISVSRTDRKTVGQRGFSLLEVLIAITVLAVGMLALAAMLSRMDTTTGKSRYMSTEALLASEKLEQLNRYPLKDVNIAVTNGITAGSLTADTTAGTVDYFDQVLVSTGEGSITETTTGKDASGNTNYATITQTPNGEIASSVSSTPPSSTGTLTFKRRWLIEKDTPVVGVSRITVKVNLQNGANDSTKNLQMSMVRQYAQ
jgi:prepilin-type N-terminal cleavage/methylation domain-containing protein